MSDLMADLRAAEAQTSDVLYQLGLRVQFMERHGHKLLALLEAGRACRDEAMAWNVSAGMASPPCVRQYDEAAKSSTAAKRGAQ